MKHLSGIERWKLARAARRRSARLLRESLILMGRRAERADTLAYLARRRTNAETMLRRSPENAEAARWTLRQLDILTDDLRGGLHQGEAMLRHELEKEL